MSFGEASDATLDEGIRGEATSCEHVPLAEHDDCSVAPVPCRLESAALFRETQGNGLRQRQIISAGRGLSLQELHGEFKRFDLCRGILQRCGTISFTRVGGVPSNCF